MDARYLSAFSEFNLDVNGPAVDLIAQLDKLISKGVRSKLKLFDWAPSGAR